MVAGTAIEKLCDSASEDSLSDRNEVVRAARCLLSSVTRVLLLADIVVVKQLLLAKDKVIIGDQCFLEMSISKFVLLNAYFQGCF